MYRLEQFHINLKAAINIIPALFSHLYICGYMFLCAHMCFQVSLSLCVCFLCVFVYVCTHTHMNIEIKCVLYFSITFHLSILDMVFR